MDWGLESWRRRRHCNLDNIRHKGMSHNAVLFALNVMTHIEYLGGSVVMNREVEFVTLLHRVPILIIKIFYKIYCGEKLQ